MMCNAVRRGPVRCKNNKKEQAGRTPGVIEPAKHVARPQVRKSIPGRPGIPMTA